MLRVVAVAAALAVVAVAAVLVGVAVVPAHAQTPRLRLAAASDCRQNPNCAPGFRRVYRFDPSGSLVRLKVADAGVQALDDGLAEVAVVFSSNPQLSRPDLLPLPLRDDKYMITRTTWSRSCGRRCSGATGRRSGGG